MYLKNIRDDVDIVYAVFHENLIWLYNCEIFWLPLIKVFYFVCFYLVLDLCKAEDVNGYPTFRYYENGEFVEKYNGGRNIEDFIQYTTKPKMPKKSEL